MEAAESNLEIAHRYLRAVETDVGSAELAAFFASDVVQVEFPNRISPRGARRDLAALLAGAERGRQVLSAQRYELRSHLEAADRVALEVEWTGTLAVALGDLRPGSQLRAHLAIFLEFENGRITSQRNYDCYEPW